jgi:hypothetical protein
MFSRLAFPLAVLALLGCMARPLCAQGLATWDDRLLQQWWAKYPTPDTWPKAADAIKAQLEAAYKSDGARVFSDTDFQAGLDQLLWVELGIACPDKISDPKDLKTFVALGQDPAVSHLFVEKLSPLDVQDQALANILRLSEANTADLHEYAALGVAYALVWDQPFPDGWPHRQVAHSAVPIGDVDIVQRFNYYVQANRNHKLVLDPTRLSFENLKYLVDSEAKLSEFEWAQKNPVSISHFADAYFSIQYANDRISNTQNVYDWPGSSYALADIKQSGGICIDQAYFAVTLGKGLGIPTMMFTGYGMDGAHAWMGYLSNSGKWELDVGRYENQDFPKGFATDPQTWQPIDDATLENLFKNGASNPSYQPEMTALEWARLHKDEASYPQILEDAHTLMPEWSATWRLRAALVDAGTDLDAKKKFYNDWIEQFGNFPEMKVEGQKRLYKVLKAADDPDADGVLKDIVLQNRSEGFDFGIGVSSDSLKEKLSAAPPDWDGARQIFERAVRDFGQQGGLTLYSKIVYPYLQMCLQNGKIDLASRGVDTVQSYMPMNAGSQVEQDFAALRNEINSRKDNEH